MSYEANKSFMPKPDQIWFVHSYVRMPAHTHTQNSPISLINVKILNKTLANRTKQPIKKSMTKRNLLQEFNNGLILKVY